MTLSTDIYVQGEIDKTRVYRKCAALVGTPHRTPEIRDSYSGDPSQIIGNPPGIGADAWLMIHFREGGWYVEDSDACNSYCSPENGEHAHEPRCFLKINFDTAYGYKGPRGEGCADLHARYIVHLGEWLDEQGIPWAWKNEFTGEVHERDDRYLKLGEFVGCGDNADAWFVGTVLPIVLAEAQRR